MRIVIFGLTVSSAWGNGHATLWRSLIRALDAAGHDVVFYERDTPYYRAHRDLPALAGRAALRLYGAWAEVAAAARVDADAADAAIVTSYCPDGRAACELVTSSRAQLTAFYDLDTPITLDQLARGADVPYLPARGLGAFDLVLSFTGGRALAMLREQLGARRTAALYGSVDPAVHRPAPAHPPWRGDASYLGTYAADRQDALDALLLAPARARPQQRFVVGGALFPADLAWPGNITHVEHVAPPDHPAFFASCPLTLSVTRRPMAALGYCPSGRLFEAAACGVPVLSDPWDGLQTFFTPGEEVLVAHTTDEALAALDLPRAELARIGHRARARVLDEHTGAHRAAELVSALEAARACPTAHRAGGAA